MWEEGESDGKGGNGDVGVNGARVRVPVGVHGGVCMVGVYCIKIFTIIE